MTSLPASAREPRRVPVAGGTLIELDRTNPEDLRFVREAYGFDAEIAGWFRERDRLFVLDGGLSETRIRDLLTGPPPPSILDVPAPPTPDGPLTQRLLAMDDGTVVDWIRHPAALPGAARPHWRTHTALFDIWNRDLRFHCYTSIPSFASLEGADGKFRVFGPGGIRWIDYPDEAAAMSDAMDMSLAVAMKIQVVRTPNGGNKIAVQGDKHRKADALRAIFAVYERMGCIITSADLGLSLDDLEAHALPVAPTTIVPMGVYAGGVPSARVTADAALGGLQAMAASLPGKPALADLTISLQGIGEVGFRLAQHLLEAGARVVMTETCADTRERFIGEQAAAVTNNRAVFLDDPDAIYDIPADIFCPCALRDILDRRNLGRLQRAGVRLVGGPANNLFPDQTEGPWIYHEAGLPVVPYEGIGAGGVTGVAFSVMTGVFGRCPFTLDDKIALIRAYVEKVLRWSQRYDLPAQVISDRILFRSTQRRRLIDQRRSEEILFALQRAFHGGDRDRERTVVAEYTKKGLFSPEGRHVPAIGDC